MKRLIATLGAALLITACTPDDPQAPAASAAAATSAWMAPPLFDAAEFADGAVIVSGRAAPGQRIVLTDRTGLAAAASADDQGAFAIRLVLGANLTLWRIDVARGAQEARTGQWLAVSGGQASAVILRAGAAARPVGPAGLLATADYDGGGLLVGGRVMPGQPVQVDLNGGPPQTVQGDEQGWIQARFAAVSPGPHRLRARGPTGEQEISLTLAAPSGDARARREGGALRIDWPTPGGAGQATWVFDPPAGSDTPSAP